MATTASDDPVMRVTRGVAAALEVELVDEADAPELLPAGSRCEWQFLTPHRRPRLVGGGETLLPQETNLVPIDVGPEVTDGLPEGRLMLRLLVPYRGTLHTADEIPVEVSPNPRGDDA